MVYIDAGEGAPIVFAHGNPTDWLHRVWNHGWRRAIGCEGVLDLHGPERRAGKGAL